MPRRVTPSTTEQKLKDLEAKYKALDAKYQALDTKDKALATQYGSSQLALSEDAAAIANGNALIGVVITKLQVSNLAVKDQIINDLQKALDTMKAIASKNTPK